MQGVAIVGQPAPLFEVSALTPDGAVGPVALDAYRGRWLALMFYPRDFSIVCPTEITAFSARYAEFVSRGCEILAISVDPVETHQQWTTAQPDEGGIGAVKFPLGSDPHGAVALRYSTWDAAKAIPLRGMFLIDPDGVLQYSVTHNLSVGRSVDELLRVLDALKTGGMCPVSWTRADGTIDVEHLLQPGLVVGHYRIEKEIGQGTFGTVFGANDLLLQRRVAVKVLRKNLLESRGQLLEEARAVARLLHPNVCSIFAIEEAEGLPLISMEFVEGETLEQLIAKGLDSPSAAKVAAGIAAGLAAAHNESIVHGDLKPANIIVQPDGAPKILDFGLARADAKQVDHAEDKQSARGKAPVAVDSLDETLDTSALQFASPAGGSSRPPGIQGTPLYMAPEQIDGQPTTTASDVFSFGLLWYELETGNRALPSGSFKQLLNRLHSATLASELSAAMPSRHQTIFAELLAASPKSRPTMQQVADALDS